ncbi:hypothetical protein [Pseudooceanicola sp. HF7]|uniref:hypothetical protein n=1 Tax=Pseudooceanicola sp. HF7 TaxID=2721560 RepID=UPI001430C738|nr:hypothetical protein [Pseudooceanicola sp. HF7]NIZ08235.1 hypothetical protein [Pseudooceanicola sp. HF7]
MLRFSIPLMLLVGLAACAPRPEGQEVLRSDPRVSGGVGVQVGPDGVRPSAGVGVSVCNNPSPFHIGIGGGVGGLGVGISC